MSMQFETLRESMEQWGVYFNRPVKSGLIDLYWQDLQHFSDATMIEIRRQTIRNGSFFPKLHELMPVMRQREADRRRDLGRSAEKLPPCKRCDSIGLLTAVAKKTDEDGKERLHTTPYRCMCSWSQRYSSFPAYDSLPGSKMADDHVSLYRAELLAFKGEDAVTAFDELLKKNREAIARGEVLKLEIPKLKQIAVEEAVVCDDLPAGPIPPIENKRWITQDADDETMPDGWDAEEGRCESPAEAGGEQYKPSPDLDADELPF